MKFNSKIFAAAMMVALSASAQVLVPASSVDSGGRAVVGFIVPTASNIRDIAMAAAPVGAVPWTSHFIGQHKTFTDLNNSSQGGYVYIDTRGHLIVFDPNMARFQSQYVGVDLGIPNVNSSMSGGPVSCLDGTEGGCSEMSFRRHHTCRPGRLRLGSN